MEKTWKPTVAGILSIVAGALGIIVGIVVAILGSIGGGVLETILSCPDLRSGLWI